MIQTIADTPKYVRYDFFMAVLGLVIAYTGYTNESAYFSESVQFILIVAGAICLFYGLKEMKMNYEKDKELQDIEYAYTKQRLIHDLMRLEKN